MEEEASFNSDNVENPVSIKPRSLATYLAILNRAFPSLNYVF
jgi:hypothetical protein